MILRWIILSCTFLSFCFADTLFLRSGASVQGNYAGGDTRQVKMMVGDHIETYGLDDVIRLEFGAAPAPPPAPRYQEQGLRTDNQDHGQDRGPEHFRTDPPSPPADVATQGIEVPTGTNFVIRMIDTVDSERDSLGQKFRASLDEPVVVNGDTVIPRGAEVVVKLVDDKESGKFAGKTVLTLDLQSVQVNGRMIDVTTSEVSQASGSRGARTAKTVGGGAVAGAVLGGIFGGGKGAAIGAASGGTVGAGAEVLTKGQKVKIPSETRLSFLLQQPLRF